MRKEPGDMAFHTLMDYWYSSSPVSNWTFPIDIEEYQSRHIVANTARVRSQRRRRCIHVKEDDLDSRPIGDL